MDVVKHYSELGSGWMLLSANWLSTMQFYFEIWLNVPPDFHYPFVLSVAYQLGSGDMITISQIPYVYLTLILEHI